ncbi:MAG: hypothetical protein Q8928_10260 [Bacteroidota bacterium]|nr:hypothetical protein [Bacteroidota bacterium]
MLRSKHLIKTIIFVVFVCSYHNSYSQQIGNGLENIITNFGDILYSGAYNGCNPTGGVPDSEHPWQHLLVLRHPNEANNYQLQIGTTFAENEKLFFRKIANNLNPKSPTWVELATRNSNMFNGNQTINGEIIWPLAQKNFSAAPREGVSPMSIRLWDNYNGGGPSSFGTLLEMYGRYGHMVSQLYFGGWDNSRIRYREAFYAQNQWNEWRYLLDSKNDIESSGNLHILGSGNHYISNGNLLIGQTSQTNSTYKLDVAGKIRTDEIVVNTSGADFVFEKNYKLRPLSEVETFIKQNKHLPDVAPAKEMQTNGVSMGDMQAKLLQKVEELTLYVIELKKENEQQKQQIEELNNKLKN